MTITAAGGTVQPQIKNTYFLLPVVLCITLDYRVFM